MKDIVDKRVDELIKDVNHLAKQGRENFSGPSRYFYSKIIDCHKRKSLKELLDDDNFYEYIYATLASWGMHRMGKKGAKMQEFDPFRESIHECRKELLSLDNRVLEKLRQDQINSTQNILLTIFRKLKIMKTNSRIVGTSKTLHFILPNLVVPMDREYTLSFFNKKYLTPKNEEKIFVELFNKFVDISQKLKYGGINFERNDFQPSIAKLIDNAIIGYKLPRK